MKTDLNQYFERIGYNGSREPTLETLRAIHRHQITSVPYENLDVYLQTPVDRDMDRIFNKIIGSGRGGWCYEINGIFGWALKEMGFDPVRHCGGVARDLDGDDIVGNHLVHTVELDGTWLVDVGLGNGILEPILLVEGPVTQGHRSFSLERLPDGFWRFHNSEDASPPTFDFRFEQADEARLDQQCEHLQSDPASLFRENLVCQRMTQSGFKYLLGRTYKDTDRGIEDHIIESEDELHSILVDDLGITPPPLDGLWDKVVSRHEELFGSAGK